MALFNSSLVLSKYIFSWGFKALDRLRSMYTNGLKIKYEKLIILWLPLTKNILFLFAYTLGIISPKKTITNVTTIVNVKNTRFDLPKIFQVKYAERVITATFTRLFNIKIVAKSFSGFWSNRIIFTKLSGPDVFIVFFCVFVSEKKATSEPEINPDKSIRLIRIDT